MIYQNNRRTIMVFALAIPIVISSFLISSCKEEFTPRPRGFFRITLPEKTYKEFSSDCPFRFEYPAYSVVSPNQQNRDEPCWFNIDFPLFRARLHLSYKQVAGDMPQLLDDSYKLAMKHQAMADAIDQELILKPEKQVYGIKYLINGEAASQVQFVLTDSTRNFFRGALYFNLSPDKDSISPVIDFINRDIDHLIESFQWVKLVE
ncbi:MAG: gliding motility lipoprotein GldD [Bacteroidales bacterium]|nr:gliding motility lipoprotein GldD [Bacteroidales bacterium]MCF8455955.1 gliding motility lipoprotein GldD [Bacteroidales bacterium]